MAYPVYQEKQWSTALWIIYSISLVSLSQLDWYAGWRGRAPEALFSDARLMIVIALALLPLLLFGRPTTSIDETHLRWHFGFLPFPAWKIPFTDMAAVEAGQCTLLEGRGIRMTRSGMLYNACGKLTINIRTKNGKLVRLGTADPQRLLAYLQPRIAG